MQELLKDLKSICEKHDITIVDASGVFFTASGKRIFKEVVITENITEYIGGESEEQERDTGDD